MKNSFDWVEIHLIKKKNNPTLCSKHFSEVKQFTNSFTVCSCALRRISLRRYDDFIVLLALVVIIIQLNDKQAKRQTLQKSEYIKYISLGICWARVRLPPVTLYSFCNFIFYSIQTAVWICQL